MADHNHKAISITLQYRRNNEPSITTELTSSHIFGDLQSGVEVRFTVASDQLQTGISRRLLPFLERTVSANIDVFILTLNDTLKDGYRNYVTGYAAWDRQYFNYALPDDLTLCSTLFLQDLYLVPCDPSSYLEMHYGKTWINPTPRQTGYWYNQHNIRDRSVLSQSEWKRRIMYRQFQFT